MVQPKPFLHLPTQYLMLFKIHITSLLKRIGLDKMSEEAKCLAVIRVRGVSDIFKKIKATLQMLHLTRNYHATLISNKPSYLGMLIKAKNYLTWGEISKENIVLLLKARGKLIGNKEINDKYAQEIGYKSLDDLAIAIYNLEVEYAHLPNIKPMFRLHPPKKGFKRKVKKSFSSGGVTGYRGKTINELVKKMT
jgi:large subunit ribosomal protein L30